MKKTNKPNPLKVFNDNKAMAYKKAGGEMAAFKKSLKRMDNGGGWHAPMALPENTKTESPMIGPMNSPTNAMRANQSINQVSPEDALRKAQESNAINAKKASFQDLKKRYDNVPPVMSKPPGVRQGLTLEQMSMLYSKKGGSVKRKKK